MIAYDANETLMFWSIITLVVACIAYFTFRKKRNKNDQPGLICKSSFSFTHSANAIKPNHKLILESVSEQLITVSFIRYYINPKGFWRRLFKKSTWKNKHWIYDDKQSDILDFEEGEQAEIMIHLPVWVDIIDVLKVIVFDQSGKASEVNWPSPSNLAILVHSEKLYETAERNEGRMCKIIGYKASGKYRIYACWNLTSTSKKFFKAKLFHFKNKNNYQKKLKDIVENQRPKLLVCEAEAIS